MSKITLSRNIYSNERERKGYNVLFKETDDDLKLIIKRVRRGKVVGGAVYYESLPKTDPYKSYFRFVLKTVKENINKIENMYFWNFGRHIFKHLLQHRE